MRLRSLEREASPPPGGVAKHPERDRTLSPVRAHPQTKGIDMQDTANAALDLRAHHVAGVAQWASRLPQMTGKDLLSLLVRLERSKANAEAAKASCMGGPMTETINAEALRVACLWALTQAEALRRMGGR